MHDSLPILKEALRDIRQLREKYPIDKITVEYMCDVPDKIGIISKNINGHNHDVTVYIALSVVIMMKENLPVEAIIKLNQDAEQIKKKHAKNDIELYFRPKHKIT